MELSDRAKPTHERPCVACRKRKIRCDKVRPCANCQRTGQLCSYDDNKTQQQDSLGHNGGATGDADMRARLDHLEKLMATLLLRGDQQHTPLSDIAGPQQQHVRSVISPAARSTVPSNASQGIHPENVFSVQPGQLVFKDGYCAYFTADFWAGLIDEV